STADHKEIFSELWVKNSFGMEYQRSFKSVFITDLKLLLLFQKIHITQRSERIHKDMSVLF
ncbi:MAG: hypothetical protein Q3Y17_00025, partial [Blautia sp.]|nr:hypothetical protein [Blautia sp.]